MTSAPATSMTSREAQRARARAGWADLRDRLATVTPAALGRTVLVVVILATIVAAVVGTWPALLPFAIGGFLAYAVLPVVDILDRFLPRALAAALGILGVLAAIAAVVVSVVPTLVAAFVEFTAAIPGADELDATVENLLADLPGGAREVVGPILVALSEGTQETLAGASGGLRAFVAGAIQVAPQVASAILGLVVLPTWILTVMSSNRRARIVLDGRLAGWLRADFWAVARLLDRSVRTFVSGYVLAAIVVGVLTWVGLMASPRLGGPAFSAPLAIAVLAGAVQVIPELGPILGFIPALLLLGIDPERAGVYVAVYLAARLLGGGFVGGRLLQDRLGVHPAILIPGVVVLSQLGPVALLLSAPILGFASDLVRYLHGRLSEPPRPAGLLPREPQPVGAAGWRPPAASRRSAGAAVVPASTVPR